MQKSMLPKFVSFLYLPLKPFCNNKCNVSRPDFEAGYRDFKNRLDNYEKVVLL